MNITKTESGRSSQIKFSGSLTDASDLAELIFTELDRVDFDLEEVKSVNSSGIMLWVRMLHRIPQSVEVTLSRCSLAIFHQLRIFPLFLDNGRAKVRSFMVEYDCPACLAEAPQLVEAAEVGPDGELPEKQCSKCSAKAGPAAFVPRKVSFLKKVTDSE